MVNQYHLIYYCDSYTSIGNGHLKRGIDILNSLSNANHQLRLAIMGNFSNNALKFIDLFLNDNIEVNENAKSKVLVIDTMFKAGNPDFINKEFCDDLKSRTNKLIMINSGMNLVIPDSIDVLIDHLPNIKITGNQKCKKFIGFDFSPVSSEFENNDNLEGNNLLFVIGGNESSDGLIQLIKSLNVLYPKEDVDMIISTHYPSNLVNSLSSIANFKLNLNQNVESIVPFFKNAHSVICTYGNTTYESLTFQRPTFTLSYEEFQFKYSNYLEKLGLIINLGYLNSIDPSNLKIIYDNYQRTNLVRNTRKHFKNAGILNITKIILDELKNV